MGAFPLYLIVSVSGASVLAVEILGTRVLGPYFGVNLFLWSALITVTLLSLSAGYWAGGRWADRGPRLDRLGRLAAGAGLWLLAVPWLREPLLAAVAPLGHRAALLAASLALFAPPLTLLGMVSPYAVRLKSDRLEGVGRVAGDLYAVSTIAGVAAALLVGFWLIPEVGVTRLTRGVGALLLASALPALARRPGAAGRPGLLALAGAAAAAALLAAGGRDRGADRSPEGGAATRDLRQSAYAELRVVDSGPRRFLLIDGGIHTVVVASTWQSAFPYVCAIEVAKQLFREPGRLLLVGLGGGSVAKSFSADGWSVDAVEVDPAVVGIARDWFGLAETDARVHVMDGRAFLAGGRDRYEAIVLDAYGSSAIPFHLVTEEAFGLAHDRLAEGGVLVVNLEALGWDDPIVARVAATVARQFAHTVALPTNEPPNALGNIVLFASDRPIEIPEDALGRPRDFLEDPDLHWAVVQRNHAWNNRFVPPTGGVVPLSDDRNPVDVMTEGINVAARRSLHADPALAGLAW